MYRSYGGLPGFTIPSTENSLMRSSVPLYVNFKNDNNNKNNNNNNNNNNKVNKRKTRTSTKMTTQGVVNKKV